MEKVAVRRLQRNRRKCRWKKEVRGPSPVWNRLACQGLAATARRLPELFWLCVCDIKAIMAASPQKIVYLLQYSLLSRALNSAVECHLHTVEVAGSNPAAPTNSHPHRNFSFPATVILLTVEFRGVPVEGSQARSRRAASGGGGAA